jgi:hypothetical protein
MSETGPSSRVAADERFSKLSADPRYAKVRSQAPPAQQHDPRFHEDSRFTSGPKVDKTGKRLAKKPKQQEEQAPADDERGDEEDLVSEFARKVRQPLAGGSWSLMQSFA